MRLHTMALRWLGVVALGVVPLLGTFGCGGAQERPAVSEREAAPEPNSEPVSQPVAEPVVTEHSPGTPGVVIGRVLGPDGPVSGLLIQMQGEELFNARSDALGEFTVDDVTPGEYLMSVVDVAAVQQGDFHIKTRATTVAPGELREEDFEFGMGVDFTGTLEGAPLATQQVQIIVVRPGAPSLTGVPLSDHQASIEMMKWIEGSDFVNSDGTFHVFDLSPGTYQVHVRVWPDANTPLDNPWPAPELIESLTVEGLPIEKTLRLPGS